MEAVNLAAAAKLVRKLIGAEARRMDLERQMELYNSGRQKWKPSKGYADWVSLKADKKNNRLVIGANHAYSDAKFAPMLAKAKALILQETGAEVEIVVEARWGHVTTPDYHVELVGGEFTRVYPDGRREACS